MGLSLQLVILRDVPSCKTVERRRHAAFVAASSNTCCKFAPREVKK